MDSPAHDGCDVAVVGGGIAGLVAAAEAASRGAAVLLLEAAGMHGGLVINVGALDDYPAPGTLSGVALAEALLARARASGAQTVAARVDRIEPAGDGYALVVDSGKRYAARSVIVATGARLRRLDVPGETALTGRGVSQCDWCDGGFFRDQPVAVVGGGDAALQAALHLAKTCSTVTVIVRGADARARQSYLTRAAEQPRIEFLWETRVAEILGADRVEGLRLESSDRHAPTSLACAGVFVFAGLVADTACVPPAVERDADGRLCTVTQFETALAGLYAVGAVRSGHRGSLAVVVGEAAAAAQAASERLRAEVS
jgi:thioredoxin reductase (NADPH)